MKKDVNFHGSDIEKVAKYYHLDKDSIHNYSGNVNPLGLSPHLKNELIKHIDLVTSYPDPDYIALKESISQYIGVSEHFILLGNGSTELIANYIEYINPKKALIIGPTYSEYEKKIITLPGIVTYYPLEAKNDFRIITTDLIAAIHEDIDLLVLCNPNNPTGSTIDTHSLHLIFDHCKSLGVHILIDETYMDFVEEDHMSAVELVESYSNCIVLRGFSKFFSAPGLRLGYGITSDIQCHQNFEAKRNHWSINSLAAFAGKELMCDIEFIQSSKNFITQERERMTQLLSQFSDLKLYPNKANFFFVELLNKAHTSHQLFEFLIKKGLMIRDTSSFPFLHGEYVRFCILSIDENNRLIEAMGEFLTTQ